MFGKFNRENVKGSRKTLVFSAIVFVVLVTTGVMFSKSNVWSDINAQIFDSVQEVDPDNPCGLSEEEQELYNCGCLIPKCLDTDWENKDTKCRSDGTLTRTWEKLGDCSKGIVHPEVEEVACEYIPPNCSSRDWKYYDEECTEDETFTRVWEKKKLCEGGVEHPESEQLPCPLVFPECIEEDWTYVDGDCEEGDIFQRLWALEKECEGGIEHPEKEELECVYVNPDEVVVEEVPEENNEILIETNDETSGTSVPGNSTASNSRQNEVKDMVLEESESIENTIEPQSLGAFNNADVKITDKECDSCPSPCCPEDYWWWFPLVIQILVLSTIIYLFKRVRYDYRLRYHELTILLASLISQLCHWMFGCSCLDHKGWCSLYGVFNLVISLIFGGYAFYIYRRDRPGKPKEDNLKTEKKSNVYSVEGEAPGKMV